MWPFSKSYSIRIHGRAGITYKEGVRTLEIDSEMLIGKYDYAIYWTKVTNWAPPYENEKLSETEKARIKVNIENRLNSLSLEWL